MQGTEFKLRVKYRVINLYGKCRFLLHFRLVYRANVGQTRGGKEQSNDKNVFVTQSDDAVYYYFSVSSTYSVKHNNTGLCKVLLVKGGTRWRSG